MQPGYYRAPCAMEFGVERLDLTVPIVTLRDQRKWATRIEIDDVIELAWNNQKDRATARVSRIDYNITNLEGRRSPYRVGTPLMLVTLVAAEPGITPKRWHIPGGAFRRD